jgi:hypothetical protein
VASLVATNPLQPSGATKLNDTGIGPIQCYELGSNTLISCTSAAAVVLDDQQDGMVGRDTTNSDNTDGRLGFSYSLVAKVGGGFFEKTECVKDNVTGLIWEGKTASGDARDGSKRFYNKGDGSAGDASQYVETVNALRICGYSDWRLPTASELHGLVDYGKGQSGPMIDVDWFPNTQAGSYWASPRPSRYQEWAWVVSFSNGFVDDFNQNVYFFSRAVRLVR